MEEQIISFKTAKLAKKKGFDIKLRHDGHVYDEDKKCIIDWIQSNHRANWNDSKYIRICSAPTQSLLQKWLRDNKICSVEVYSEHINEDTGQPLWIADLKYLASVRDINMYLNNELGEDGDLYIQPERIIYQNGISKTFNSYEEALEKGLQEALKLI